MIYIGTSGWSYKHWRCIFYPEKMAARNYLSFYAEVFTVTEVNSSFYRLPQPETIRNWISAVPPGFLFCPKMSRYLTHVKKLNDPQESLSRFFTLFAPFKKRLGPILIQLPASVTFHQEKVALFFSTLRSNYKNYQYAVEARHESWFGAPATGLLKKFRISIVVAESGGRWPSQEIITAKDLYLRFHGPDGSYGTSYSDQALEGFAKKMLAWEAQGHTIWAFFNNDLNGYAPANARTLAAKLTEYRTA